MHIRQIFGTGSVILTVPFCIILFRYLSEFIIDCSSPECQEYVDYISFVLGMILGFITSRKIYKYLNGRDLV